MPDGFGGFRGDSRLTAATLGEFAHNGWLNIVGGCCGTRPDWIAAIGKAVEGKPPRKIPEPPHWSSYSGMEPMSSAPRPGSSWSANGPPSPARASSPA